jgi:hypothetical protein
MSDIEDRQKRLTELGSKARAGTLMSTLFRAVASEATELIAVKVPGRKDGKLQTLLVSKAEAIVRDIVQQALPITAKELEDMDMKEIAVRTKEQLECRKLILDRVDGRAGAVGEDNKERGESVPNKISRMNKDFLNDQAKGTTKEKPKKKSSPPKV